MKSHKSEPETAAPPAEAPAAAIGVPVDVSAGPLTAGQVKDLQDKAARAVENWDHYLRAVADLENYKKRAARERQDALKFGNESLIAKLIPILDNFEMAQNAAQNGQAETLQSLHAGIGMVQSQLKSILAEAGLEEVDAAGKTFDPNLHEALSQEETAEIPEGQVLRQLRKGYRLRERLLRPASVVVARAPAANPK
jgi:molecular chaperone GrpE